MTRKIWFSYSIPQGFSIDDPEFINSPYSISWNMGRFLRERARERGYAFEYRNLDSDADDVIGADDIIIGHLLYPNGWMVRALDSEARLKFILQPYHHFQTAQTEEGWMQAQYAKATHTFAICGRYWWDTMGQSVYAACKANMTRVDMAVNADIHPYSKTAWGKPGKRGVLVLGNDAWYKGLSEAIELCRVGGYRMGYCGSAAYERFQHVAQFKHYGGVAFTPDTIAALCREYDFFVTMGSADANPTTLLETAAWGLIGACTETSGYYANYPFIGLKKSLVDNLEIIDRLQDMSEYELRERSRRLREVVETEYTWVRFMKTVWGKISEHLD